MSTGINTVQQLLDDAVTYDLPYVAHLIYYMLLSKKVELHSPVESIESVQLSQQEYNDFYRLYQSDALSIRPIKLFAVQLKQREFAFYFAKTAEEVHLLHTQLFQMTAQKIFNAHNQMIWHDLYFPDSKQTKSFKELLQETIEFPTFICTLESRW